MAGEIRAARQFIKSGDVVFDVGANRGEWSTSIHDHLNGWEGFYLFEPQRSCYPYLSHLQAAGATLVQAAVGEKAGTATLLSPAEGAGNASLHPRKDTYFAGQDFRPTEVPIISLDDFMAERKIENVAFMKMDIEGHELAAMRGASYALSHGMIKALQFEFGSGNINSNTMFRDHWDLLRGHGYRLYRVLIGGRLLPITAYDETLEHYRGVSNYIAVR